MQPPPLAEAMGKLRQCISEIVKEALKGRDETGKNLDPGTQRLHELSEDVMGQVTGLQETSALYETQLQRVVKELGATRGDMQQLQRQMAKLQHEHASAVSGFSKEKRRAKQELDDLYDEEKAYKMRIEFLEQRASRIHNELDHSIEEEDSIRGQLLDLTHKLALEEREKEHLARDLASAMTALKECKGEGQFWSTVLDATSPSFCLAPSDAASPGDVWDEPHSGSFRIPEGGRAMGSGGYH